MEEGQPEQSTMGGKGMTTLEPESRGGKNLEKRSWSSQFGLAQGSTNHDCPEKSSLPFVFVNKVLLKHMNAI